VWGRVYFKGFFMKGYITVGNVIALIIYAFLFIYSIIFHEIMHGVAAMMFGDETAKRAGRITLNPVPHIDPFGSILLPAVGLLFKFISGTSFIIGWAKPVPVNPYNFKYRRWGEITVSLAGVSANFIMMVLMLYIFSITAIGVFLDVAATNFFLIYLNILPIPPLDGYNFVINILPERISEIIAGFVRGRETVFLGILFLLFATPIGRIIFFPASKMFESLSSYLLQSMGVRG
jgi:Zn-dependent protease